MAIDQAAMIRTIYDTIFSAYTQPPLPGLPPISQPSTTFLARYSLPSVELDE